MTIFGDNVAADNSSQSNCGFALHTGTRTDQLMNYVFGLSLLIIAVLSLVANTSVLFYYSKRRATGFSEFERIRRYVTIVRSAIDLLYNTRSIHVAYVLFSNKHEQICGEHQPTPIVILSIIMYSLFMLSLSMTFVISVMNYANISTPLFRLDFRHSYRLIIFIVTIVSFACIIVLELEGTLGPFEWFSPNQLPLHRQNNAIHTGLKWSVFSFKAIVLVFHITFAVQGIIRLRELVRKLEILHVRYIYVSMIWLILGNCICLIVSLVKDLVTDFVDFAKDQTIFHSETDKIHPYYEMYIVFVSDVLIESILSAYNPIVFIRNSVLAQKTIKRAITEAVTFTGISISRRPSLLPSIFSKATNRETGERKVAFVEEGHAPPPSPRLQSILSEDATTGGGYYRTLSVSIWTSAESREPVVGSNVKLPLNHIPSIPIITIPVHRIQFPMTLPFIGQGSFGKVYKFTDNAIGCSVAIKHIDIPSSAARSEVENVKKEVSSELLYYLNFSAVTLSKHTYRNSHRNTWEGWQLNKINYNRCQVDLFDTNRP